MNYFLFLSPIAGFVIGIIFFGGLWFTVNIGLASQNQALWFLGSLLLRTGIVLVGFYCFGAVTWQRMLLCRFGFVIPGGAGNRCDDGDTAGRHIDDLAWEFAAIRQHIAAEQIDANALVAPALLGVWQRLRFGLQQGHAVVDPSFHHRLFTHR